jgi:RNA polymerase sigma-70 factor, ECF subfamily
MSTATMTKQSGEALARDLEAIFRENYQFVFRTAYGITGCRLDAEDVLQAVFLKLLQRDIPADIKKTPKAYLYRAAVNSSLNIVRSRKRHPSTDVDNLEVPARAVDANEDEIQRLLLEAIAQLKPTAVEILILRYEHNYSDAQIAKLLGRSRSAIAVMLYRTRARLKKLLNAASGETL